MQLRSKILLLVVALAMVLAGVVAYMVEAHGHALVASQIEDIEEIREAPAHNELHRLLQIARTAIPELDQAAPTDDATRRRVLEQLRKLDFGDNKNGYFYVYDLNGNNVMHGHDPELEGKNHLDLTDDHGQPIIRQLLHVAVTSGRDGGFMPYRWPRSMAQSPRVWADKIGLVVYLPNWGWMLGTGLYLDDIKEEKEQVARMIERSLRALSAASVKNEVAWIAVIALIAALVGGGLVLSLSISQRRLADDRLRQANHRISTVEETERARLASALHDEAMQDVIAVGVILDSALGTLQREPARAATVAELERAQLALRKCIEDIRQVSHGLRPRLPHDGICALISETAKAFEARAGVVAAVDAPPILQAVSDDIAIALFRITQQALDNVKRHAAATHVTIQLTATRRRGVAGTRLIVTDDGHGFDLAAVESSAKSGIGLLHMGERIEALGGRLRIRSNARGTRIQVFLPNQVSREAKSYGDRKDGGEHDA